ncbi:MAG: cupin domain-containing protein [Candidatus Taylorbacteria bacterium]|nr:cupin domain-containing protein [Candidatus Taylorbacteria bacterium]
MSKPILIARDNRGIIEKLADGNYRAVLRITSKKGTVRANHYHKIGSHLCYLASGQIEYVWRDTVDESDPVQKKLIKPGDLFFSPPMVPHAMHFLEDSEFYTFETADTRKDQAAYENDLVRVHLVEPEIPLIADKKNGK